MDRTKQRLKHQSARFLSDWSYDADASHIPSLLLFFVCFEFEIFFNFLDIGLICLFWYVIDIEKYCDLYFAFFGSILNDFEIF